MSNIKIDAESIDTAAARVLEMAGWPAVSLDIIYRYQGKDGGSVWMVRVDGHCVAESKDGPGEAILAAIVWARTQAAAEMRKHQDDADRIRRMLESS